MNTQKNLIFLSTPPNSKRNIRRSSQPRRQNRYVPYLQLLGDRHDSKPADPEVFSRNCQKVKIKKEPQFFQMWNHIKSLQTENMRLKKTVELMENQQSNYCMINDEKIAPYTIKIQKEDLYIQNIELKTSFHLVNQKNLKLNTLVAKLEAEKQKLIKQIDQLLVEEREGIDKSTRGTFALRVNKTERRERIPLDKSLVIQKMRGECRTLRKQNEGLKEENEKLKDLIEIQNNQINQLKIEKTVLLEQNAGLELKLQNRMKKTMQKQEEKMMSLGTSIHTHMLNLIEENKTTMVREEALKRRVRQFRQTIQKLQKSIVQYEVANKQLTTEIMGLKRNRIIIVEVGVQVELGWEDKGVNTDQFNLHPQSYKSSVIQEQRMAQVIAKQEERKTAEMKQANLFMMLFISRMEGHKISKDFLMNQLRQKVHDNFTQSDLKVMLSCKPFSLTPKDQDIFLSLFNLHFREDSSHSSLSKDHILQFFSKLMDNVTIRSEKQEESFLVDYSKKVHKKINTFNKFFLTNSLGNVSLEQIDILLVKLGLINEGKKILLSKLLYPSYDIDHVDPLPLKEWYLKYSQEPILANSISIKSTEIPMACSQRKEQQSLLTSKGNLEHSQS